MVNKFFSHRFAPLIAFLALAFAGGLGLHESQVHTATALYTNNLNSCARGNKVRVSFTTATNDLRTSNGVINTFLNDAATAREASFRMTHSAPDLKAAQEYRALSAQILANNAKLQSYPQVNCLKVVTKP